MCVYMSIYMCLCMYWYAYTCVCISCMHTIYHTIYTVRIIVCVSCVYIIYHNVYTIHITEFPFPQWEKLLKLL